jgi:hypothetical protein
VAPVKFPVVALARSVALHIGAFEGLKLLAVLALSVAGFCALN